MLIKPQYYTVEEGRLYAGEYPGSLAPEVAHERLQHLVDLGIRTFVDLTTTDDGLEPYSGALHQLAKESGLSLRRIAMPITDMGVPRSPAVMREILDAVKGAIDQSPAVYIHCWGGIGRTGTVVGCWLRETGLGSEQALAQVQHLYATHMPKVKSHPESPQTPAQKNYVRNWKPLT